MHYITVTANIVFGILNAIISGWQVIPYDNCLWSIALMISWRLISVLIVCPAFLVQTWNGTKEEQDQALAQKDQNKHKHFGGEGGEVLPFVSKWLPTDLNDLGTN